MARRSPAPAPQPPPAPSVTMREAIAREIAARRAVCRANVNAFLVDAKDNPYSAFSYSGATTLRSAGGLKALAVAERLLRGASLGELVLRLQDYINECAGEPSNNSVPLTNMMDQAALTEAVRLLQYVVSVTQSTDNYLPETP